MSTRNVCLTKLGVFLALALLLSLGLKVVKYPCGRWEVNFWGIFPEHYCPGLRATGALETVKRAQDMYWVLYDVYAPSGEALKSAVLEGWWFDDLPGDYEIRVSGDGKGWSATAVSPRYAQVYFVSDKMEEPHLLGLNPESTELELNRKHR